MKYEYNIVTEKNRVEICISEGFDLDQWVEHTMSLQEDPEFDLGMDTLCELQLPDDHDTTVEILKKVEGMLQGAIGQGVINTKIAMLIKNKGDKEIVEMLKVVVERLSLSIEAFYELEEAIEWLEK